MDNETDVLEFDFPDYEEPYPPFPDVKVALFDKEDSYKRNRSIADGIYADRQKEEEQRREELRRAELEKIKRLNPAALQPKSKAAKIVSVIAAVLAITAMLATSFTSGGTLTPDIVDMASVTGSCQYSAENAEFTVSAEMSRYSTYINKLSIDLSAENFTQKELRIYPEKFYIQNGPRNRYHMGSCTVIDGITEYSDNEIDFAAFDRYGKLRVYMECKIEQADYYDGVFGYDDGEDGGLNFEISLKELLEDND
ncbi:MAG: hypothetical protein K2J73_12625 [Oscillospiraceae bacterium]|nr:hypothetical protein [Oscillospiraceae bacterium]